MTSVNRRATVGEVDSLSLQILHLICGHFGRLEWPQIMCWCGLSNLAITLSDGANSSWHAGQRSFRSWVTR